ncbi:MAG: hypothetical protein ACN4E2_05775 [Nitrospinota bacterium]
MNNYIHTFDKAINVTRETLEGTPIKELSSIETGYNRVRYLYNKWQELCEYLRIQKVRNVNSII